MGKGKAMYSRIGERNTPRELSLLKMIWVSFAVLSLGLACAKKTNPDYGQAEVQNSASQGLTIVEQPQDVTLNTGQLLKLSVYVTAEDVPTYQWSKDGLDLVNQSARELVIPSASLVHSGAYQVRITLANGQELRSRSTFVTVLPAAEAATISITSQPQSVEAQTGSAVEFQVTATASNPLVTLSYQWRKGGVDIPGAINPQLSIAKVTAADLGEYQVLIRAGSSSLLSDAVALKSPQTPHIVAEPPSEEDRQFREAHTLKVEVESSVPVNYKWLANNQAIVDDSERTGSNTSKLEFRSVGVRDLGIEFKLKISGAFGEIIRGPYTLRPIHVSYTNLGSNSCKARYCRANTLTADALCREKTNDKNARAIAYTKSPTSNRNFAMYSGTVNLVYKTDLKMYVSEGGAWKIDTECNNCQNEGYIKAVTCQK